MSGLTFLILLSSAVLANSLRATDGGRSLRAEATGGTARDAATTDALLAAPDWKCPMEASQDTPLLEQLVTLRAPWNVRGGPFGIVTTE